MRARSLSVVLLSALFVLSALPVLGGTQDFVLVNDTGVEIYRLYISETGNDEWEEDVLDEDTLPDGSRVNIRFSGRSACLWDLRVEDEDGEALEWDAIDLCESSVVVLRCNSQECWAEYE